MAVKILKLENEEPEDGPVASERPPLPHSVEAEEGLISACLQWPEVVDKCVGTLTPAHFVDKRLQAVFHCIEGLRRRGTPVECGTVYETLQAEGRLNTAGGRKFIIALGGGEPTSALAALHLETVVNKAALRSLIDLSRRSLQEAQGANGDAAEIIAGFQAKAAGLFSQAAPAAGLSGRAFDSFSLQQPDDPNILLGNRWLCRGDGAILASTSGMGKSSLLFQAAVCWALGRDLFGGCRPNRPLTTLIFQSEDSDGDIAEMKESLFHAMKLTAAEQAEVGRRVIVVTDRIHRGPSFRAELKRQIALHHPDLVAINPLLAFIGGDVNDAAEAGQFLREYLNGLNEPPTHAYIIVHHTAKPPKERADRRWNEVMYDMAGSADLTNWARAIMSLRPSEKDGSFNLVFAKRGIRAGYTKEVDQGAGVRLEPVTTIGIRHSRDRLDIEGRSIGLIHWVPCDVTADTAGMTNGAGRRPTIALDTILAAFPVGKEKALGHRAILKFAREIRPSIGNSTLERLIDEGLQIGVVSKDLTNPKAPKYFLETGP